MSETEFSKKARAFLEPMAGVGPRAVWLQWIETIELDQESYTPAELRLIKRATVSLQTVMTMARNKDTEGKLSAIELLVKSKAGVEKSREARRKR